MLFTNKNNAKIILAALLLSACSPKSVPRKIGANEHITLKVMTYNIHHANPPSKAKEGVIDVDAVAAAIKKQHPDLVGIQEVDKGTKRSGNIDEAALLGQKTGMHYQFFKAIDHDGGDYGLCILSRYPIITSNKIDLPQVAKGEPRILSYITINVRGKWDVTFADTHLDATHTDSNRVVQMKRLIEELGKRSGPVILTGDLNCDPAKEPIHILDHYFKRSCVDGCPFTIPQINPNKTIDYIALKNADWEITDHQVIAETYASDHRPVTAIFHLK